MLWIEKVNHVITANLRRSSSTNAHSSPSSFFRSGQIWAVESFIRFLKIKKRKKKNTSGSMGEFLRLWLKNSFINNFYVQLVSGNCTGYRSDIKLYFKVFLFKSVPRTVKVVVLPYIQRDRVQGKNGQKMAGCGQMKMNGNCNISRVTINVNVSL